MKKIYIKDEFFKPSLDNITLLSHLYHKKSYNYKKNKNIIHICQSLNNKYIYQALVSISTVLMNCNYSSTFIIYHVLCNPDVTNNTLTILKSLMNKYYSNLEIIFYDMGKTFINRFDHYYSQSTYYRLLTPIFLDTDRLIYLDGDSITLKDLNEMYRLSLDDNYVLGFLDVLSGGVDYLGVKSEKYICAGVILLNLEKIRNDNKTYQLINISKSNVKLRHVDQTIINYVFYPKIGIFPDNIGIWNFYDRGDIEKYLTFLRTKKDINQLEKALLDPVIIHCVLCSPKIWSPHSKFNEALTACKKRGDCDCKKFHNLWHFYANKTDYYKDILKSLNMISG